MISFTDHEQNVTVDVIIYLMPIYPVWGLQTSFKRRIQLIAVFTAGGAAVTISLLRFVVLWQLANAADTSYIFGSVTIVTSYEFGVAIITNNLPGLAAFWKTYRTGTSTDSKASTGLPGSSGPANSGFEMGNVSKASGGRVRRKASDSIALQSRDEDAKWVMHSVHEGSADTLYRPKEQGIESRDI